MSHNGWTCGCGRQNKRNRDHCAACGLHKHDCNAGQHSAVGSGQGSKGKQPVKPAGKKKS